MSFQAMTWAVGLKLPPNQKLVLLMLANRTNPDDGRCFPSIARLADDCGMSPSTVHRTIAALADLKFLTVVPRAGPNGVSLSNSYILHTGREKPAEGEGVKLTGGGCQPEGGEGVTMTPKTEKGKQKEETNPPLEVPPWVPTEAWEAFKLNRIALRKPMTNLAERRMLEKLERLRTAGHDPTEVLDQSIRAGWTDIYAVKNYTTKTTATPTKRQEIHDELSRQIAAVDRVLAARNRHFP